MSTRILVADDSATVRTLARRTLVGAGYEVEMACDGAEAVQMARTNPPDLAVLDINMPAMDGFAVCQEFRRHGAPLDETPIILLTVSESHALRMLGDALGAYLHKPLVPEKLLETIEQLLEARAVGV